MAAKGNGGWTQAVIVVQAGEKAHRAERKAAQILRETIAERTGLDWPVRDTVPADHPVILLEQSDHAPSEGFTIRLETPGTAPPRLHLAAHSGRAALFAVGRLLRWLEMQPGKVTLPRREPGILLETEPAFPLRGHQLGYRSTPNTYDAWNEAQFERYIRELALFGVNSIELIPTLDPNEAPTPLMPLPPWEMNRRLSELLDAYDLDAWIWLTTTDGDPAKPDDFQAMLHRREILFRSMPRLNHVFVPGGDPGDIPPAVLFPFLEKLAERLRRVHPQAGLWLSPQGFDAAQMEDFYRLLRQEPKWLTGAVHGPWVRETIPDFRKAVPARYRLRLYPDIGHCVRCQYPVPQWDRAFALTLGREPINPRPVAQAHIHNHFMNHSEGSLTYSEGVNDDVNKFVWSERMWNPQRPVREILVEYGRLFFGPEQAEKVADGLLALEANWHGPLHRNPQPRRTLAIWEKLWNAPVASGQRNWRLQQGVFRAVYDVYVQERLRGETAQERDALAILKQAGAIGAEVAAKRARARLWTRFATPETDAMRSRLLELGEALWKSIGMQMSVPLYHADRAERGAVLDFLDAPLNDRGWLLEGIESARALSTEAERVAALQALTAWTDVPPGSFYDALGNAEREPHLARGDWAGDPGFLRSAQDEFGAWKENFRLSWGTQASTLYGTDLTLYYTALDPNAAYRLRVVYNGRFRAKMRLTANASAEIHGPLSGTNPPTVFTFDLPQAVTQSGELRLDWHCVEGRGCQVAEVWLLQE